MFVCLISASWSASAHTPQDAIDVLHISPDYGNDSTLFLVVQNYLLRSTNRGASSKQLASGLDSQHVYSDISISPTYRENSTLFVATDGGGVYRSTNKGDSWHRFNDNLPNLNIGIILVANASTVIAAGSERGLFLSAVDQSSWKRVISDDVQITSLRSVQDENGTRVLAGDSAGGLWSSNTDLTQWQRIFKLDKTGAVTALAYDNTQTEMPTLYIGTEQAGLLKTRDLGETLLPISEAWPDKTDDCLGRPLAAAQADVHIRDIELVSSPDNTQVIYVTTWNSAVHVSADGGGSWQTWSQGITCDNQADSYSNNVPHFRDLESSDESGGDLFVAGFDGLYRSEDRGRTWVQFETLPVHLIRGMDVSVVGGGQYGLALTTYGGGAYVSTDQGKSWVIANQGLVTTRLADIEFSPDFPANSQIYGLAKERFLVSQQAETGWIPSSLVYRGWRRTFGSRLERYLNFSPEFGSKLFLSDAERRRVWPMQIELSPEYSTDQTVLIGLRRHGVWRSVDAGESWDREWYGPTGFVTALQISPDFPTDKTAFVGMRGTGIYVTRNGADSWYPANRGFRFLAEIQAPESPNYYIDPPLYTAAKDVLLAVSPSFASDQTVFASSAVGLFKSSDAGRSWSKMTVSPSLIDVPVIGVGVSPEFKDDGVVVVSLKGRGLFRSNDGGETFAFIGQDLLDKNYDLKFIEFSPDFANDDVIYGAADEVLLQSRDGGLTWSIVDRPVRYEDWRGEDRGPIRFENDWTRETGRQFSASTQAISSQSGAAAKLNFFRSEITWLGERGPDAGIATVLLDGKIVANVDLYSEERETQTSVLRLTDLAREPHDILIEVTSRANPLSKGNKVAVDGFDVKGF